MASRHEESKAFWASHSSTLTVSADGGCILRYLAVQLKTREGWAVCAYSRLSHAQCSMS